jgi:uncharacterized membrane protein
MAEERANVMSSALTEEISAPPLSLGIATNDVGLRGLTDHEHSLLRTLRSKYRPHPVEHATEPPISFGQKAADAVALSVGSWRFLIFQSVLLMIWIALNVLGWVKAWDPYPFILLNLMLSFQAAYTAPVLLMSQNRQAMIDRLAAKSDYEVNLKAQLEIELLHQKIDLMRENEIARLLSLVERLEARLEAAERGID